MAKMIKGEAGARISVGVRGAGTRANPGAGPMAGAGTGAGAGLGVRNGKIPVGDAGRDLPLHLFLSLSVVLTTASTLLLDLDWGRILDRIPRLGSVFRDMLRFSPERFSLTLLTLAETVTVSILALIYGMMIGLVLGALAADNLTPWKPLSLALKSVFAFIRAVPTPVWVLLVLASMGFGMASGVVGLGFHAAAFFGKVFAQLFEEVPEETVEAVSSAGASRIQIFFNAVLPASLSGILAWTALRFETNYVEAAILGMVGAGGVGYTILAAMSSYKFGRAGLAVLVVFVFALAIELLTTYIKRKVKI
ncbi:MAG: ABC transporter permease subunit [Peptococcaceae bacterium]|jgi:phosphonate transport system permease protein|nr:ABC transporter permease subunit [Peptococcaceae bacterium]